MNVEEDLGKRLLAEVEEIGLSEVLQILRQNEPDSIEYAFGLPPLDHLVRTRKKAGVTVRDAPVIELISPQPGGGKTQLLYHLVAVAILPSYLGGKHSCVVMLDLDDHFDIRRLIRQLMKLAQERNQPLDNEAIDTVLQHVHVYNVHSLKASVATVQTLPSKILDPAKHGSFDRPLAFIALDSVSAFSWQARADKDDATLLASTSRGADLLVQNSPDYAQLAAALKTMMKFFDCPVIYTCRYQGHNKSAAPFLDGSRSLRPSLPPSWSTFPTLRLIVRRIPVRKFPFEITVDQALVEAGNRQKVVEEGRFECLINEWGNERPTMEVTGDGHGFEFHITHDGIDFAR